MSLKKLFSENQAMNSGDWVAAANGLAKLLATSVCAGAGLHALIGGTVPSFGHQGDIALAALLIVCGLMIWVLPAFELWDAIKAKAGWSDMEDNPE